MNGAVEFVSYFGFVVERQLAEADEAAEVLVCLRSNEVIQHSQPSGLRRQIALDSDRSATAPLHRFRCDPLCSACRRSRSGGASRGVTTARYRYRARHRREPPVILPYGYSDSQSRAPAIRGFGCQFELGYTSVDAKDRKFDFHAEVILRGGTDDFRWCLEILCAVGLYQSANTERAMYRRSP